MTTEQAQTKLRIIKNKIFLLRMDSEQEVLTSEEIEKLKSLEEERKNLEKLLKIS